MPLLPRRWTALCPSYSLAGGGHNPQRAGYARDVDRLAPPAEVLDSPLLARGGWRVLEGLLAEPAWRALCEEAEARRSDAVRTESSAPDPEEGRGGDPPRAFFSATGGVVQDAFYASEGLHALLGREIGCRVRPSAERGTYSYYEKPGDHLGLHRDLGDCDLSVITCLRDEGGPRDAGALRIWPRGLARPLSTIRGAPDLGGVEVRVAPGETLILLGGYLPHALLAVAPGQERVVSVLCFRVGEGGEP